MNVQFVPCIHLLPRSLQSLICVRLTVRAFWKNRSIAECVLWKITFVDTKLRGIEATCIFVVMGRPRISSRSQVKQQKPWRWIAKEFFVLVFMNTINNEGTLPKAH